MISIQKVILVAGIGVAVLSAGNIMSADEDCIPLTRQDSLGKMLAIGLATAGDAVKVTVDDSNDIAVGYMQGVESVDRGLIHVMACAWVTGLLTQLVPHKTRWLYVIVTVRGVGPMMWRIQTKDCRRALLPGGKVDMEILMAALQRIK